MKNWIAAFLFLVSWQEYRTQFAETDWQPASKGSTTTWTSDGKGIYTVETVDKSITLKTQEDVDKFLHGGKEEIPSGYRFYSGVIDVKAFNVKVKELEEPK